MQTIPTPDGMRIAPSLPPGAFKTYQIIAPVRTHFRPGTCKEADCPAYLNGFIVTVDESTELGQKQAYYIRHDKTRHATEEHPAPGATVFRFTPGQKCFGGAHQIRIERPEIFVARDGDWRGNPSGMVMRHTSSESWVDDFATHQDRLKTQSDRG